MAHATRQRKQRPFWCSFRHGDHHPMKAPLPALTLLVTIGLAAACSTGARPAWTYSPASSASPASPSGGPSGDPAATPTPAAQSSDDVLPILTPKAQLS